MTTNHDPADREAVTRLAARVLSSWATTARFLVVAATLIGLSALALGLLQVDLVLGPLEITRH